jgi:hypothetical protein
VARAVKTSDEPPAAAVGWSVARRRSAFALEVAGLDLPEMLVIRVTVPAADEEARALPQMEFIRRM